MLLLLWLRLTPAFPAPDQPYRTRAWFAAWPSCAWLLEERVTWRKFRMPARLVFHLRPGHHGAGLTRQELFLPQLYRSKSLAEPCSYAPDIATQLVLRQLLLTRPG